VTGTGLDAVPDYYYYYYYYLSPLYRVFHNYLTATNHNSGI
jgi:hypothetical protein